MRPSNRYSDANTQNSLLFVMDPKTRCLDDYTVGWLCALECEALVGELMFDKIHDRLQYPNHDENIYTFGEINNHNVVIVRLPTGRAGKASARETALFMKSTFPMMKIYLFVGIGGGLLYNTLPWEREPIHLGDVVVSSPKESQNPAVVEIDMEDDIQVASSQTASWISQLHSS
jgi:nucleoside phosphorylase